VAGELTPSPGEAPTSPSPYAEELLLRARVSYPPELLDEMVLRELQPGAPQSPDTVVPGYDRVHYGCCCLGLASTRGHLHAQLTFTRDGPRHRPSRWSPRL
jgi:hypothetical protein